MTKVYVLAIGVLIVGVILRAVQSQIRNRGGLKGAGGQGRYIYKKQEFFMSRAEHECYDTLVAAMGNDYHIFAQVHLPTIVEHKIVGQNWKGAFRHIDEKSVDFVLCDKAYISPKLAIELDDATHGRPDRQSRDEEVGRILSEAGVPLLRLENRGHFDPRDLEQRIKVALGA